MTRRDMLKAVGATLIGGGILAFGFLPHPRFLVKAWTRSRLGDWTIADADLDRFLDAFEKHYGKPSPQLDVFIHILIMSTDAFEPRTGKTLAYKTLYHPYASPCYNPLMRR